MFKRILAPVDGSQASVKALVAALQLARETGARVMLLHVIDALDVLSYGDAYGPYLSDLERIARDAGEKVLTDCGEIARSAGIEAESRLVHTAGTRFGTTVAKAAEDWKADAVVIGSHGRRGFSRFVMGSGAEDVARSSSIPVMIVPATATAEDGR